MAELDFYIHVKSNIRGDGIEFVEVYPHDVVQVVRCSNCKWLQCNMRGDGYLPKGVPEYECRHWCGEVDPIDFCSRGKIDND